MEGIENNQEKDELFAKWFNYGYLLNKYEPELLAKILSKTRLEAEFQEGLHAGKKLQELEKVDSQTKTQDRDRDI